MGRILVGRENPKEVSVGVTLRVPAQNEVTDAEEEKAQVQVPAEADDVPAVEVQVASPEAGNVPETKAAPVKGRGKKRGKA